MEKVSGPEPKFVQNLFNNISPTYDLANDVITFGMARAWRRKTVELSGVKPGDQVLDCATGTGDLALEFKVAVGPKGQVVGTDFSEGMLKFAPLKAKARDLDVKFAIADATNLPYPDLQFDVASIAYGIRNVENRAKAISEMARVLKVGGRLMILETGEVRNPVLKRLIRFHFENIVPVLGGLVSGRRDAYEYLQKSSGRFPGGQAYMTELMNSGLFTEVTSTSLMGGASYIYRAVRK